MKRAEEKIANFYLWIVCIFTLFIMFLYFYNTIQSVMPMLVDLEKKIVCLFFLYCFSFFLWMANVPHVVLVQPIENLSFKWYRCLLVVQSGQGRGTLYLPRASVVNVNDVVKVVVSREKNFCDGTKMNPEPDAILRFWKIWNIVYS